MLFQQKNKKAFKIIWTVLCVIIILSMVLLYIPGLFL